MDSDEAQEVVRKLNRQLIQAQETIIVQENDIKSLQSRCSVLLQEKSQSESSKTLQETIVSQQINGMNAEIGRLNDEIQRLKDRLRKYEGE